MTEIGTTQAGAWPLSGAHLAGPMALGQLDDVLPPYIGITRTTGALAYVSARALPFLTVPTGRDVGQAAASITPAMAATFAALCAPPLDIGARHSQNWEGVIDGEAHLLTLQRIVLDADHDVILFQSRSGTAATPSEADNHADDLPHLVAAHGSASVFVDNTLSLRWFTPKATEIFRFKDIDIGRPIDTFGATIDVPRLAARARAVMEDGKTANHDFETSDGRAIYDVRFYPFQRGTQGRAGLILALTDVTDMRRLEAQLEHEIDISRQRQREIDELYDITPQAMGLIAPDMTYLRVNQRLARINGLLVEDHLGKRIDEVVPDIGEQVTAPVRQVLKTGNRIESLRIEGRTALRPTEDRIWETDWYPVRNAQRVIIGVGVNVRDVTEQVETGKELRRVMQELHHRVQNMLANVSALVSRAARQATTDRHVFEALMSRVRALSATHSLLTEANWSSVPLMNLLEPELTAVYGAERVTLTGRRIEVGARAALALGLAIHELATNAAKYGAFSQPGGHVDLSWERRDDGLRDRYIFNWVETGGPPSAAPNHKGYGTQLISSTIEGSLEGLLTMEWAQTGLTCRFELPMAILTENPLEGGFDKI